MFENICSYGTAFRLTVEPLCAFSKAAIAFRKPASSASVPHVVKLSVPGAVDGFDAEGTKPQPASRRGAARTPEVPRSWRLVRVTADKDVRAPSTLTGSPDHSRVLLGSRGRLGSRGDRRRAALGRLDHRVGS